MQSSGLQAEMLQAVFMYTAWGMVCTVQSLHASRSGPRLWWRVLPGTLGRSRMSDFELVTDHLTIRNLSLSPNCVCERFPMFHIVTPHGVRTHPFKSWHTRAGEIA